MKREAIIEVARKQRPEIGDNAMIAEMEWGYWVNIDTYVKKEDVKLHLRKEATNDRET